MIPPYTWFVSQYSYSIIFKRKFEKINNMVYFVYYLNGNILS